MSSKCFVPSCKNNVGIAFPEDPEIKEKWLDILGIPHLQPKPSSFVCLDHFQDDEDLDEIPNTESGKISSNLKQVTTKTNPDQIVIEGKIVKIGSIETEKPESHGDEEADDPDQSQENVSSEHTEICRLCMEQKEDTKNIFVEEIEDSIPIVFAILACIHPIEISYEDNLSKNICIDCLNILQVCFKFRSVCLKNDKIQKQSLRTQASPIIKKQKRKGEETTEQVKKKTKSADHEDKYDELEAINEFLVKKDGKEIIKTEDTKNMHDDKISQNNNSQNESMNRMEEELRKVLEGSLSEEHASADNIIIHIENDDDDDDYSADDTEETLSNIDLPVGIGDSQKTTKSKRAVLHEDYSLDKPENIRSKEANVNSGKGFKSNIGVFEGTPITYFYDVQFCEVDDYLFEYRIAKQTQRNMRCLLPSCSATAVQSRLEKYEYSNEVTVLTPHNHKCPDESEQKKQMFFYVMKRKMHSDKTLKFKNVYDDVCQKDPEIKQLIPLRNVINEICRHQFNHKLIPITSFDILCNHIEDDAYQKFQFTLEGAQFYQEKFTAEDNAKAIVFANLDTIEEMSDSELMYIDASFKIESGESFAYQLVTVLVWIEESYYPIMFALVNYKTQEIYKKIFEFLHDTLAPRLRPDEIVTEYESNLYYALGEIYVDSSIGGSAFYYTQNIYKKICYLDLAKDLETNTYFRNVYHMLLMLPLLPVNTILDGFQNIQAQATQMGITHLTKDLFEHMESEWLNKVTPDLFCVHRLENRINENVIAPFKKLRDYIMLSKGKRNVPDIMVVIEKLIELEQFLHVTYTSGNKKSFARDLSSAQKKNVLRAWQFIETHPKININNFFSRVLGYIKCMENQLWIWGFYRYKGEVTDELINASNFSIISSDLEPGADMVEAAEMSEEAQEETENEEEIEKTDDPTQIVMDAVIDENGGFVLKPRKKPNSKTYNVTYK